MQMSLGKPDPDAVHILDVTALKAYTHPLRLQIIRYLADHGSATATELARHLGESTGQTSYHLRQLAHHGMVEDDPARGSGRERWWKPTSFRVDASTLRHDPAVAAAARTLLTAVAADRAEALDRWIEAAVTEADTWVGSSVLSQSTLVMSPDELAEMNREVQAVIDRFTERYRDRLDHDPSAGTRRVRTYYDAFPLALADDAAPPG
jgi:DNA-binding transcriptional ArsR family regulator